MNIDAPETTIARRSQLQAKPFLRKIYEHWYDRIRSSLPDSSLGPVVEIGSGGGFLNRYLPGVWSTEVFWVPHVDSVLDARALPFSNNCLGAIVLVDVFHHIPDTAAFLAEADRCLKPGGRVIMIEPWLTPWSRFIYKCFHHEPVAPFARQWRLTGSGPLSTANSALPWIVFHRDRNRFDNQFPDLTVMELTLFDPFAYLISGGFSYPSALPAAWTSRLLRLETFFPSLMPLAAMFAKIVLKKNE